MTLSKPNWNEFYESMRVHNGKVFNGMVFWIFKNKTFMHGRLNYELIDYKIIQDIKEDRFILIGRYFLDDVDVITGILKKR